jgi:hypothetical protein
VGLNLTITRKEYSIYSLTIEVRNRRSLLLSTNPASKRKNKKIVRIVAAPPVARTPLASEMKVPVSMKSPTEPSLKRMTLGLRRVVQLT